MACERGSRTRENTSTLKFHETVLRSLPGGSWRTDFRSGTWIWRESAVSCKNLTSPDRKAEAGSRDPASPDSNRSDVDRLDLRNEALSVI
jgi:hypothetical protein